MWSSLPSSGRHWNKCFHRVNPVETLELNDAGNLLDTNKGIAAHFNLFFSTVGKKLAEKFRGVKSKIKNPYGEHKNLFSFTEVTPELIRKQLDSLDVKKRQV